MGNCCGKKKSNLVDKKPIIEEWQRPVVTPPKMFTFEEESKSY
jgi:hypothetical protein